MKKRLELLSEFLDNELCDWSDMKYDYTDIEPSGESKTYVDVSIRYLARYVELKFQIYGNMIYLFYGEEYHEADTKMFWINAAPYLFPISKS